MGWAARREGLSGRDLDKIMSVCLAPITKELQDVQEEVQDVQVEVNSCEDVVIDAELALLVIPAHDQLGVVNDVEDKQDNSAAGVQHVDLAVHHDTHRDHDHHHEAETQHGQQAAH